MTVAQEAESTDLRPRRPWMRAGLHLFLLAATAIFVFPLVWMVLTALKPNEQTMKNPPEWLPRTETATLTREFRLRLDETREPIADPRPERIAVVRLATLDAPHVLVKGGRETAGDRRDAERFVDRRMLIAAADLRASGGAWGEAPAAGAAEMRFKVGAEPEKRLFACEVLETYPAGWVQVRESIPDDRLLTKTAGSGEDVLYAWGVVPPEDLRKEVRFFWENVPASMRKMDFGRYLLNTLWVAILGMIGTTFVSALAAYAFAFGSFRAKAILFGLTLATMMVPFPATMVPLYGVYRELDWIGTFKPLWVHSWFGAAFNIFLLRQFFLGLPKDLLDAARIDGCSELQIFFYVVLPLSKPALAMVALFHFLYAWKDFMGPLLYLTDKGQFTLSLGLQAFQSQQGSTPWHLVMAAAAVFSLPLVLLFLLAIKTFIRGVAMTGIKG